MISKCDFFSGWQDDCPTQSYVSLQYARQYLTLVTARRPLLFIARFFFFLLIIGKSFLAYDAISFTLLIRSVVACFVTT